MPESHKERRQKFLQRLARLRDANPGWDIRKAPPREIGWIAEHAGDRLHAPTLSELEALLADRREPERQPPDRQTAT